MRKGWDWADTHPLAMFVIMFGLRDIIFGTSLAVSDPLYIGSNLYQTLLNWRAIPAFGIFMALLGALSIAGAIKDWNRVVSIASGIRAYGWGFATVSLLIVGSFSVASLYLTCYVMTTAFGGYRYKWIRQTGIPTNPRGVYERKSDLL